MILACPSVCGQTTIEVGIDFYETSIAESSLNPGFKLGTDIGFPFKNPSWSIQLGTYFVRHKINYKVNERTNFHKTDFNSIEVPVLFRYSLEGLENNIHVHIEGGVFARYGLWGTDREYTYNKYGAEHIKKYSSFRDFNRLSVGYQFGFGLTNGIILAKLYYVGDLTEFKKNLGDCLSKIGLSLGYTF